MTDSTVAAMAAASALDGTELYYGVQGGVDGKVTGAQIKTLCSNTPTLLTPVISGGLTASGSGANDFSASTGTFKTSTGVNTIGGELDLKAGTATIAPIKFASGTNLTTATAGALEYDGSVLYGTHAANERGVVGTEQFISMQGGTFTLTSQTAAQKLFNSPTNGAVTVAIGTYQFECEYDLSSMSASSGSFGFQLGGTAVTSFIKWISYADKAALATAAAPQATVNVTNANTTIATASTNTVGWAHIRGIVRVTTGGTLIPQVSLGVAAAAIVGRDSFFRIWPVGNGTVTSVGNWS